MDLRERVRRLAAEGGDLSSVRAGLDQALRASLTLRRRVHRYRRPGHDAVDELFHLRASAGG